MSFRYRYILFLLVSVSMAVANHSCVRQELEEDFYSTALIPVRIDWSLTDLDPDNDPNGDIFSASVWFFPKSGSRYQGAPLVYKLSNPRGQNIEVPIGIYSILIFNNTIDEYSGNVGFRGTDRYETFEYYSKPNLASNNTRAGEITPILEPDYLAAWRMDTYEVTPDMVMVTRSMTKANMSESRIISADVATKALSAITPLPLTKRVHIVIKVVNINAAKAAQGNFINTSHSVFLAQGSYTNSASSFVFPLNNRKYLEGSNTVGTIEATFNTFGLREGNILGQYMLSTTFILNSEYGGSMVYPTPPAAPYLFDVTKEFTESIASVIVISIGFNAGPGGDPATAIPPELPEGIGAGGNGGGLFGISVEEWGEVEDIPVRF